MTESAGVPKVITTGRALVENPFEAPFPTSDPEEGGHPTRPLPNDVERRFGPLRVRAPEE